MSSQDILGALQKMEGNLAERFTIEMDRRFGEMRLEMNGRFDAIEARFDRLQTEYHMIAAALRRIEDRLTAGDRDRHAMQTEVADLKVRIAQLNERVRELEMKLDR
jgi:chromosome segregation ATPase